MCVKELFDVLKPLFDLQIHTNDIVVSVSVFFAIMAYRSDVKHKKTRLTMDSIAEFLNGKWISYQNKKIWNEFVSERLCSNSCAKYDFNGKYMADWYDEYFNLSRMSVESDVAEVFTEGPGESIGYALIAVLDNLEFIARETMSGNFDSNLVKLRLFRFYYIALRICEWANLSYPEISRLYKQFGGDYESCGDIMTFYADSQPQRAAKTIVLKH